MTDAIHAIRAVMPHAFRYDRRRLWRRAMDLLGGSISPIVRRRERTTLRVSAAWLRENEIAAGKRQDE